MELTSFKIDIPASAGLDDGGVQALLSGVEDLAWDFAVLSASAARRDRNHKNPWTLFWLLDATPEAAELLDLLHRAAANAEIRLPPLSVNDCVIEPVAADTNWLEQSYRQFPPFREGRFFIHGSHDADAASPSDAIRLQIDAATAFGSGEHGTTAGCLNILETLKGSGFSPKTILDLGTGSGILAVAAHRLWARPVLATDIDAEAVRVADHHRAINGVPDGPGGMTCVAGDGFAAPELQQKNTFDLIIANILAGPLKTMADDISARAADGGFIVLSGMLHDQADEVLAAYAPCGATEERRIERGEWTSLLLRQKNRSTV